MSITNIASGSRPLRKHSKMLARVIIVFAAYIFLSSSSISVLSVYGQLYFPSNTIQSSLPSSNLVSPFLSISRQSISPWFPSLPAISCGAGIFSFTIEGVPDKGVKVPINDDDNDDGNLMALQIELERIIQACSLSITMTFLEKFLSGRTTLKLIKEMTLM